jgi:Xaa-Pro dipeptidase
MTIPSEIAVKTERLAELARASNLGGVLLTLQRNFSWLTGGASNRIDGSREVGAGTLLVSAGGRRFVIANTIERPRLVDEALAGMGFELLEFPWAAEHGDPATVVRLAASALHRTEGTASSRTEGTPLEVPRQDSGAARLGCDGPLPDTIALEPSIARLRAPLTPEELQRYRTLGSEVGVALGDLCHMLTPGQSEAEIAGEVIATAARIGARAIVTLVGADDRIARYRHPIATEKRWERLVLVALCAERHGLVVSLSRIVSAGPMTKKIAERTRSTASVFAQLLAATRTGASGATLFATAAKAYASEGFPGEELLHHQGGAIGYRSREWLAHPDSTEQVRAPQAFAWNPSITGTKVEDTALITDAGVELITTSPAWPSIDVRVGDQSIAAAQVLELPA